jgi:uncharacterized protein (DUF1697 family)
MARYLALLRGINVGGKNIIKMADLKACFVDEGFEPVTTYIQSGNVVFDARGRSAAKLAERIADRLAAEFDYDASLVLLEAGQMRRVVDGAPPGFGADPDRFRSDVIFLMPGLDAADALRDVPTREGVDRTWAGEGALYFERLTARASQSRLSRITTLPIYQRLTIRNWNTTTKLLEILERS